MTKQELLDKLKSKAQEIVNSIWFVIIVGILIFFKTMILYYNSIAITERLPGTTVLGTILFILAICGLISTLPNRTRIIVTMVVNLFISLLFFGDDVYYTYSNSVLSVAQITNIQYGEEIISTLPLIIKFEQIFYFLDILIFIFLWIFGIIKIHKKEKSTKKQLIQKIATGVTSIVIFILVCMVYIKSGIDKSYNKDWQIRESTIIGYHIYDIKEAFNIKKRSKYKKYDDMIADYNKLKENYETKYGQEMYAFENLASGKNVIILQLESLQEFLVNKEINGKQITPNLNKFLNENIQFSNMYMQSYSSTADSEHSTITSIYPMENGMSFSKYYSNTYDDIFKLFKQKNYHTSYMHGNYPYFWNRGNVYEKFHLNEIALKPQFEDTSEEINGYLSDELLYKQAVQKMKTYSQPFFSFIVSASSHTPFLLEGLEDRNKINIDVGKYKDTYFGYYLEAANYADYAFGIFIKELKNEGLYDDTTILIFGDHNGLTMYNEEMIDFLKQLNPEITDIDLKLNYIRVLCGLKLPINSNLGPINIEKPVNKLDIKPTFAYLCGLTDRFSLGTNMFKSKDFVCLNNERIVTSRYYYDTNWYDIQTGEMLNMETIDEDTKKLLEEYYKNMKNEIDISTSISVNNLLKNKLNE